MVYKTKTVTGPSKIYSTPAFVPQEGLTSKKIYVIRIVFDTIRSRRLYLRDGKSGAQIALSAVRNVLPDSSFKAKDYPWCLSRWRRQKKLGLPVDRVVRIPR